MKIIIGLYAIGVFCQVTLIDLRPMFSFRSRQLEADYFQRGINIELYNSFPKTARPWRSSESCCSAQPIIQQKSKGAGLHSSLLNEIPSRMKTPLSSLSSKKIFLRSIPRTMM